MPFVRVAGYHDSCEIILLHRPSEWCGLACRSGSCYFTLLAYVHVPQPHAWRATSILQQAPLARQHTPPSPTHPSLPLPPPPPTLQTQYPPASPPALTQAANLASSKNPSSRQATTNIFAASSGNIYLLQPQLMRMLRAHAAAPARPRSAVRVSAGSWRACSCRGYPFAHGRGRLRLELRGRVSRLRCLAGVAADEEGNVVSGSSFLSPPIKILEERFEEIPLHQHVSGTVQLRETGDFALRRMQFEKVAVVA